MTFVEKGGHVNMKRSYVVPLFAAALFVGMLLPNVASAAPTLNIESSMKARCLDVGCTLVEFVLEVGEGSPPDIYVSWFAIRSKGTLWRFGSIQSIVDKNGDPVQALWQVGADEVMIENYGIGLDPLTIVVQMNQADNPFTLHQLTYTGIGNTEFNQDQGEFVGFQGNVVPEPITLVLLGSGLAGLAGAAGLRRKRTDPTSDV